MNHKTLFPVHTKLRKDGVIMTQRNQNKFTNSTKTSSTSQQDKYSNCNHCDQYGSVEPLPESSRPRRDGPGGEDGE